jgi:3'-phosphoadenosine 5'-phosphosulfate sulfotransferase (PAPS reductase)/FAD synthetase
MNRLAGRRVVASISGGKDSAAMSLWLTEQGIDHDRVFLDTGWEHPATYDYLRGELAAKIGPITWLSSPHKMVSTILRKGMFPSRQRRFCTQELKVFPMQRHLNALIEGGAELVNAVGIRAAESANRAKLAEWEWSDGFDCEVWRPLIAWTEDDVIAIHQRNDLRPNPLYLRGAKRVGCFPCIYASKAEIRLVAEIAPERIDLIERLEARSIRAARTRAIERGEPDADVERAWFQDPMPVKKTCADCGGVGCDECGGRGTRRLGKPWPISKVVEWSRTSRGGRQIEMFEPPDSERGCMRWGLCETGDQ